MTGEPEHLRIADEIPALIWRGAGAGPRPAIVTIHGGGGSKQDVDARTVERLTSIGVTLVSIDVYLHGEHVPPNFDRRALGESSLPLLLEIYEHTARDLCTVLARLRNDAAVDGDRIGIRGGSMGGYIVLASIGMAIPACAALSVCGAADYTRTFTRRLQRQNLDEAEIARRIQEVEPRIREVDPLFHLDGFPPRPVMMIHGARDPLVPIEAHRALYDALVPRYRSRPQDCLFLTHAGGHETPQSIEELGWDWLIRQIST
jgi:dipeptidyl aminopeptidase/acylaminoacyl peptidase